MCEVEYDTTVKKNKDPDVWTWKIPREVNGEGVDSMCIMHSSGVKEWKLEPTFAYACIDLRNQGGCYPRNRNWQVGKRNGRRMSLQNLGYILHACGSLDLN